MIVAPERVDIPETPYRAIAAEYLGSLVQLESPAFIVQGDPEGDGRDAVEMIRELTVEMGGEFGVRQAAFAASVGWHVDYRPSSFFLPRLMVNTHWTEGEGRVRAEIMAPKPPFWNERVEPNDLSGIPIVLRPHLMQGEVDDRLVIPKMHVGEVGGSRVLVFAVSGPQASLHNIVGLTDERESISYESWLPFNKS
jgi:hypothetical protein